MQVLLYQIEESFDIYLDGVMTIQTYVATLTLKSFSSVAVSNILLWMLTSRTIYNETLAGHMFCVSSALYQN